MATFVILHRFSNPTQFYIIFEKPMFLMLIFSNHFSNFFSVLVVNVAYMGEREHASQSQPIRVPTKIALLLM